jgi:predicted O-methyltransferase YrrM
MTRLPFRNSFDYIRAATFFDALTPRSKDALLDMILEDDFQGATDPQALSLMYALLAHNNFASVLQLGTWMGFSTIVLADALQRSSAIYKRTVTLDSVECDRNMHDRARTYIQRAGLENVVRCIDGSTLDKRVAAALKTEYDFVYVDSSHSYEGTKQEIEIYYPRVRRGGTMVFHDSSEYAAIWDPTGNGGVRLALNEWVKSPDGPREHLFLERPCWQSDCGLFILKRT